MFSEAAEEVCPRATVFGLTSGAEGPGGKRQIARDWTCFEGVILC